MPAPRQRECGLSAQSALDSSSRVRRPPPVALREVFRRIRRVRNKRVRIRRRRKNFAFARLAAQIGTDALRSHERVRFAHCFEPVRSLPAGAARRWPACADTLDEARTVLGFPRGWDTRPPLADHRAVRDDRPARGLRPVRPVVTRPRASRSRWPDARSSSSARARVQPRAIKSLGDSRSIRAVIGAGGSQCDNSEALSPCSGRTHGAGPLAARAVPPGPHGCPRFLAPTGAPMFSATRAATLVVGVVVGTIRHLRELARWCSRRSRHGARSRCHEHGRRSRCSLACIHRPDISIAPPT